MLSNDRLSLRLPGPHSGWSLRFDGVPAALTETQIGLEFDRSGRRVHWSGGVGEVIGQRTEIADAVHGRVSRLAAHVTPPSTELSLVTEFALPDDRPYLLWRVVVRNQGPGAALVHSIDLARVGPRFASSQAGSLRLAERHDDLAVLVNGYQSWSFSASLSARDRMPRSIFGPLGDPKHMNSVSPRPARRGHFVSEMFGVLADRRAGTGILAGFIAQREQFGAVEMVCDKEAPSLRLTAQCDGVRLAPGGELHTDWALIQAIDTRAPDPLAGYITAAAHENGARLPEGTPVGWCSWYQYFQNISEDKFLANVAAAGRVRPELPLSLAQLDDGFEPHVGDWFETNPGFPHGLQWTADRTRERGLTPGLWLAPFIATSDSRLSSDHPDWFIRDRGGRLANAGYNWWKWCHGLDLTHPAVEEHTRRLIDTAVREWGFPYLKLDFLYAGALPGRRHDPTRTRAQALRHGLEVIRDAAGEGVFLLGCGCPLGSAIGVVDGMRIGTDVAPNWEPSLFHPVFSPLLRDEPTFVSTRLAIRGALVRAPMHRRWWLNDPDCLLVRGTGTRLSRDEVISLATVIALSGGMFLLSDDLAALSPERRKIVESLLPVVGQSALPRDWLDRPMPEVFTLPLSGPVGDWLLVGLFNWDDRPAERTLDLSTLGLAKANGYLVYEFWKGELLGCPPVTSPASLASGNAPGGRWGPAPILALQTPAHGGHLLAVRARHDGPQFVASTLHFSQGWEVKTWDPEDRQLSLTIELARVAAGEIWLSIPGANIRAAVDGSAVHVRNESHGVCAVPVKVNGSAEVRVEWD